MKQHPSWIQSSTLRIAACLIGTIGLLQAATHAHADTYPSKPIRLIVPFPPGGGTDMIARTVAQKVTEKTSWNIVVDNRPGAGGNLGVDAAAKSPADGYTLVLGQTSNLAINPSLYAKLPYDPRKDLQPIALVSSSPILMVASPKASFRNMTEVVQAAKASPDVVTVGYAGNGTVAHLAAAQAEMAAGMKLRHVPYKGVAQALTDISSGQIDLFMGSIPSLIGQVRNGKLKPVTVTSKERSGQLPEISTIAESGYPSFNAITWFGILAPANTPQPIVQQLNTAINDALREPDVADKLRSEGGEVLGGTPEAFAQLIDQEITHWNTIVKSSRASIN